MIMRVMQQTKPPKSILRFSNNTDNDSMECSNTYNCGTCSDNINGVVQCRSCHGTPYIDASNNVYPYILKQIQNTVGVSSSEYAMNLASINVWTSPSDKSKVNWNQYSDRPVASILSNNNVPSRGSSTRSSITRLRPGSSSAPGKGVDVKHGSYARYLARLKGKGPLREQSSKTASTTAKYGGKIKKYNIVSGCVKSC